MRVLAGPATPDRERAWWCGKRLLAVPLSLLLAAVACGCGDGATGVEEGQGGSVAEESGGTVGAPHGEDGTEAGEKAATETGDKAGTEAETDTGTEAETGYIVCLDPGHAETPYRMDAETGLNTRD